MSESVRLTGLRILLLEDELFISTALREHFMMAGADTVDIASTVEAAVTCAQETRYDAAVLDIVLPDGETLGLAGRLNSQGVRIVFHSGQHPTEGVGEAAPNARFLQKPSEPDALIEALAGAKQSQ